MPTPSDEPLAVRDLRARFASQPIDHSQRFRQVSNLYPHMVALAYGRDLAAAAEASDEDVARRVAAYERGRGWTPRDWSAIGREERGDDPPAALDDRD